MSAVMAAAETLASVAAAAGSSNKASARSDHTLTTPPGAEPKKRTRPVSACEACRAKKVKCLLSPDAPVCQNCLSTGKQCLFRVDDLAPALRASRFAHCGPPGANARTLASQKNAVKTKVRKSSPDSAEQPAKRTKSENVETDAQPSTSVGVKPKTKAVFRCYANPTNLAAPLPTPLPPSPESRADSRFSPSRQLHDVEGFIRPRHSFGASEAESFGPQGFPLASRTFSRTSSNYTPHANVHSADPTDRYAHPRDSPHYSHAIDAISAPSRASLAHAPPAFLQHSDRSDRSPRSGDYHDHHFSEYHDRSLPSMPPRRKSYLPEPRAKRLPLDPSSDEYYGHQPEYHPVGFKSRPSFNGRKEIAEAYRSPHSASAELRDGIERWQRQGIPRPQSDVEIKEMKTVEPEQDPVPAPRAKIVLPFFRWFGTTANTPGYCKIKVGVLQDEDLSGDNDLASALETNQKPGPSEDEQTYFKRDGDLHPSPMPLQGASPNARFDKAPSSVTRELFEINRPRYPRKDILEHLVTLFLSHFKPSWCPWMENEELISGVQNGTMPAILANAVCAVAARFSDNQDLRKATRKASGDPFSEMSKILIIPLLSFPSIEVIEVLILLSYAEFAAGSDSGLWMYVGMALRMAQDLGLQHEPSILSIPNEKNQEKARLLFWAVIGLDRITTFGTGRPVSIRESDIDAVLPKIAPGSDMTDETVVFGHVIRILMLRGRMGELLNLRERDDSTVSAEQNRRDLTRMWYELAQSYSDLPTNLHFNVQTFQQSAAHNQSPGFVYLHVLFQSTIGLLDRPALMKKFTSDSAPLLPSFAPAAGAAASRTIADILTLGDAFDDRCITASPYLDQLVLPAGRSFVAERAAAREALRSMGHGVTPAPSRPPSRSGVPRQPSRASALVTTKSYAEINLVACQRILEKLQQYWAGASWPLRALEQEAAGKGLDTDLQTFDEDAQSAPIRDVEMVLKWAKSRMQSRKREAESGRATLTLDARPATGDELHRVDKTVASDDFGSAHSGNSPFGLGISAGLTFDLEALMGSWPMDQISSLPTFPPAARHEEGPSAYASGQVGSYSSPGSLHQRRASLSTSAHGQASTPAYGNANMDASHMPTPAPPSSSLQSHARPGSTTTMLSNPGQLDTSSFAMAEFFSHDQSIWPLSLQNEEIDQDAVNLIASALQLPLYQ